MNPGKWWKGPVKQQADFNNLLKVLKRQKPSRPTLFELFLNKDLHSYLAGPEAAEWPESRPFRPSLTRMLAYRNAGYDYLTIAASDFKFPRGERRHDGRTISLNEGAMITDRESFKRFKWFEPEDFDTAKIDTLYENRPEGMKLVILSPGGVLENVIAITGYDNLCFILADDPDLARDIFDSVGSRLLRYYGLALSHPYTGAIMLNDDWGFKTQTMLAPDDMQRYVIPWHKKMADLGHSQGKLVMMHSCGQLEAVMDDIIDVIRFDGKHSFEDNITSVEQMYDKYSDRIAIIGGIDVDFICRHTPDEVYRRSKAMIEKTGCKGYALGSGNSIPDYVPMQNYLAMISAAIETRF